MTAIEVNSTTTTTATARVLSASAAQAATARMMPRVSKGAAEAREGSKTSLQRVVNGGDRGRRHCWPDAARATGAATSLRHRPHRRQAHSERLRERSGTGDGGSSSSGKVLANERRPEDYRQRELISWSPSAAALATPSSSSTSASGAGSGGSRARQRAAQRHHRQQHRQGRYRYGRRAAVATFCRRGSGLRWPRPLRRRRERRLGEREGHNGEEKKWRVRRQSCPGEQSVVFPGGRRAAGASICTACTATTTTTSRRLRPRPRLR